MDTTSSVSRVCGEEDAVVREKEKISCNVRREKTNHGEVDCFFPIIYISIIVQNT